MRPKIKYILKYRFLFIILFLIGALIPFLTQDKIITDEIAGDTELVNLAIEKKITLITHYVVGQDTIETRMEKVKSIAELKAEYEGWEVIKEDEQEIVLKRYVEDIGPDVKLGSYFSLNPDGFLTLYRGNSDEQDVIQTFFRIDIERLESGLP